VTVIETSRLLLRPWRPDDLAELTRLLSDPEVTRYIVLNEQRFTPEDVAGVSARTLEQWERNGFGPWVAIEKATGRWVGRIGLNEILDWPGPDNVEVGWELHQEFWGRGLPPRAAAPACATASRSWGWTGSSAPPWPPTRPLGG
jgi:RimJ/RimL family protein N-acetyltransferase